jgi:hypothetical protein
MTQVAESDGRDYFGRGYDTGYAKGFAAGRGKERYLYGLLHGSFLTALLIWFLL